MNKELILSELDEAKDDYNLADVELTMEDAERVIELCEGGMERTEAIAKVLEGIYWERYK